MAFASFCLSSSLFATRDASPIRLPPATYRAPEVATVIAQRRRPGRVVVAAGAGGKKKYKGTAKREAALAEMIEQKVAEARDACEGAKEGSDGCRVAWDEVEEVSQAKADLRRRLAEDDADPLEPFCNNHPESDECVVLYDSDEERKK